MLRGIQPPVGACLVVVVQVGAGEHAGVRLAQIAKLVANLQPMLGHRAQLRGGVVLGRQVEVVGLRVIGARVGRHPERRRKETRLALLLDRKSQVGRREDGHVLEVQHAVGRHALVRCEIDVQLIGLDVPGGIRARTSAVRHVCQAHLVAVEHIGPGANPRAAVFHPEVGLVDTGRAILGVIGDGRTGDDVAIADHARVDLRVHDADLLVVVDDVRLEHGILAPNRSVAPELDGVLGIPDDLVGIQEHRHAPFGNSRFAEGRRQPQAVDHDASARCGGRTISRRVLRLNRRDTT